jgi:hypothetical protein
MNATQLVLWTGLLTAAFGSVPLPQEQKQEQKEEKKKSQNPVTRFFEDEGERLGKEVEGTWTLFDYTDPSDLALDDVASGFATFHDGFLTLTLAMDTVDRSLLGLSEYTILDSGIYRYRIDEQANLQLASVMSFSNQTDDGEVERDPPGQVLEYFMRLQDGVLELRDPEGVLLSFRKIAAGDFPDSAIRKLDRRRSGTDQWQVDDDR